MGIWGEGEDSHRRGKEKSERKVEMLPGPPQHGRQTLCVKGAEGEEREYSSMDLKE